MEDTMEGFNVEPILSYRKRIYDGIPINLKWASSPTSTPMDVNATIIPLKADSNIAFLLDTNSTPEIRALQIGDDHVRSIFKSGIATDRYLCTNYASYKVAPGNYWMKANENTDENVFVTSYWTDSGVNRQTSRPDSMSNKIDKPCKVQVYIHAAKDTLLFLYDVGFQLLKTGTSFINYAQEFVTTVQRILALSVRVGDVMQQFIPALGYIAPEYVELARNVYNSFRAITSWPNQVTDVINTINNLPAIEDQNEVNQIEA